MGVAASHCPVLVSLFRDLARTFSFLPSCSASLALSISSFLSFFLVSLSFLLYPFFLNISPSRTFFPPLSLSLSFYFSPSPLFSTISLPFADSFSAIFSLSLFIELEKILSPSRPRLLASPLVLSLHRGCLYSVFHCGSHTCPVAGWPSLACRWRRAPGLGAGDEGRGQPGAFSRLGGVRWLARGERRVRERNKISVEGGDWWRRMSSRVGRWKREDEAAGEHREYEEEEDEGMRKETRKRTSMRERERDCAEVSHPCPATRANYPTSHFLPGCVPCFFDLG